MLTAPTAQQKGKPLGSVFTKLQRTHPNTEDYETKDRILGREQETRRASGRMLPLVSRWTGA